MIGYLEPPIKVVPRNPFWLQWKGDIILDDPDFEDQMKRLFHLPGFSLRLHLTLGGHKLFSSHFFLCLYWIELRTQLKPRDAVLYNAQKHQDWLCFVVTTRLQSPHEKKRQFYCWEFWGSKFFFLLFAEIAVKRKYVFRVFAINAECGFWGWDCIRGVIP